jgi:hypothetical protein
MWLFWVSTLLVTIFPLCGLFWFLFRFNIPFFNAGDRWAGILLIAIWWLSCSLNIFGWRLRGRNSNPEKKLGEIDN